MSEITIPGWLMIGLGVLLLANVVLDAYKGFLRKKLNHEEKLDREYMRKRRAEEKP